MRWIKCSRVVLGEIKNCSKGEKINKNRRAINWQSLVNLQRVWSTKTQIALHNGDPVCRRKKLNANSTLPWIPTIIVVCTTKSLSCPADVQGYDSIIFRRYHRHNPYSCVAQFSINFTTRAKNSPTPPSIKLSQRIWHDKSNVQWSIETWPSWTASWMNSQRHGEFICSSFLQMRRADCDYTVWQVGNDWIRLGLKNDGFLLGLRESKFERFCGEGQQQRCWIVGRCLVATVLCLANLVTVKGPANHIFEKNQWERCGLWFW